MSAAEVKLIDSYFTKINNLSNEGKLELIKRLQQSLKVSRKFENESWEDLFGSLKLDKTSDELIDELKRDRSFSRDIIDL